MWPDLTQIQKEHSTVVHQTRQGTKHSAQSDSDTLVEVSSKQYRPFVEFAQEVLDQLHWSHLTSRCLLLCNMINRIHSNQRRHLNALHIKFW